MERRFLTWVIASTAFLFIYITLNFYFGPPPRPPAVDNPPAEVADADVPLDDPTADLAAAPPADPDADQADPAAGESPRPTEPSWQTMGSFDPAQGYLMLVTANSRGGAIERIELTERKPNGRLKYRRVDVRSGYLGYLALGRGDQIGEGCRVHVVGPGTPAAVALPDQPDLPPGLQVGDLIVAADGTEITSPDDLRRVLLATVPGTRLSLEVLREAPAADAGDDAPAAEADESTADESTADESTADESTADESTADESTSDESTDDESTADESTADEQPVVEATAAPRRLRFIATLTEHPLDLVRLASTAGHDTLPGNLDRLSCLMTLSVVGRRPIVVGQRELSGLPSQHTAIWDVLPQNAEAQNAEPQNAAEPQTTEAPTGQTLAYRLPVSPAALRKLKAEPVELRRRYTLRPGSYLIDMDLSVINRGESPQQLAYRLEGPNGLTLEGWWYSTKISPNFGGAGARDVVYNTATSGHELVGAYALLEHAKEQADDPDKVLFAPTGNEGEQQLKYIGVDAQYFSVAYLPPEGQAFSTAFRRGAGIVVADPSDIPAHKERAVNTSFFLDSETAEVAPGDALHHRVRMFAGPKQPELLARYGMSSFVEYGWFPMVAKPLQWILHFFNNYLVGNYAIAIVMLTLVVRGCMFPLSRKAALHAQKMQEIAPELKKIAETYKDDMEKRLKAQRELQQRVGFNPLSGCLPMFIQLPIFIGLYRCLSIDIELRQAALHPSLQWCSNLAGPDMLFYWGDWLWTYLSGRGTGWLGPYFNILPVVVMCLFLAQQKMFMPPATDEQTAMTQKVMTIMTVVMGLFFFRVPAGLCIYFITSSLWGIAERKLVKKTIPAQPMPSAASLEGKQSKGSAGGLGSSKLADRIRSSMGAAPPQEIGGGQKRRRPPVKKKR